MKAARQSIAAASYAMFALEQPISLVELEAAARDLRFPMAGTQTPGWFAAAAHDDYSLLETAPELLVLPTNLASAADIDVTGIDLIHVYAPELAEAASGGSAGLESRTSPAAVAEPEPGPELPRTSTQIGLLKELSNLDA